MNKTTEREALADHVEQSLTMVAPKGYALISIEALKAWGKHDEVRSACRFPAEPVKQEPVAWMDFHGNVKNNEEINDYITAGWGKDKVATYSIPLYAAPVDAKAIRAEALEEAAKVCDDEATKAFDEDAEDWGRGSVWCAAAIRGLK